MRFRASVLLFLVYVLLIHATETNFKCPTVWENEPAANSRPLDRLDSETQNIVHNAIEVTLDNGRTSLTRSSLAFSPNGNVLCAVASDGSVQVWRIANKAMMVGLRAEGNVTSCTRLKDGYHVLGTTTGVLVVLNGEHKPVYQYTGHIRGENNVPVSASIVEHRMDVAGSLVVSADSNGVVQQWAISTAQEVYRAGFKGRITCLAISPDGSDVLVQTTRKPYAYFINNPSIANAQPRLDSPASGVAQPPPNAVSCDIGPVFRKDANTTVQWGCSAYGDGPLVALWDIPSRAVVHVIHAAQRSISDCKISFDGQLLGVSGSEGVTLWSLRGADSLTPPVMVAQYTPPHVTPLPAPAVALAFSPQSSEVAFQTADGKLHVARLDGIGAATDSAELTSLLLNNNPNVSPTDVLDGVSALHIAAASGSFAVANALLDRTRELKATTDSKMTALHFASLGGHTSVIQAILHRTGAGVPPSRRLAVDVDAPDMQQRTPLHLAVMSGRPSAVCVLLDAGASVKLTDAHGDAPLHIAARSRNPEIIKLLVKAGADVNQANGSGMTPMALANDPHVVEAFFPDFY